VTKCTFVQFTTLRDALFEHAVEMKQYMHHISAESHSRSQSDSTTKRQARQEACWDQIDHAVEVVRCRF
jgi:hypothetical protein